MVDVGLEARTIPRVFDAQVQHRPEAVFLVSADSSFSYGQAEHEITRRALAFRAMGIQPGVRVAFCMSNSVDMLFAIFAVLHLGGTAVLVNPELNGELLGYVLADSQPALLVADLECLDLIDEALTHDPSLLDRGMTGVTTRAVPVGRHRLPWTVLPTTQPGAAPEDAEWEHPRYCDPALVMYTSGTTGRPKGVVLSHAHAVTLGLALVEPLELSADDRFYVFLPLFHAMATCTSVIGAMAVGGSVALTRKFTASGFWAEAEQLEATVFCTPASVLEILLRREVTPLEQRHRVRAAYSIPLPRDPQAFEERFAIPLATGYAMTETPPISNGRLREAYHDNSCVGELRSDYVDVRIADDDDREVGAGSVGQILVRPVEPWTGAAHYLNRPEATLDAHRNLWFHTGDLGKVEDGRLYFTGRKKESLRRRGEFISPSEIETVMSRCPLIRDVVAMPVPSELGEDDVAIVVVATDPAVVDLHAQIHAHALQSLPRFMVPRFVAVIEELPLTATGKVEKGQLMSELERDRSTLWDVERGNGRQ